MPRVTDRAGVLVEVARLAAARPGTTVFIGVDGQAGAGKSTLAAAIAAGVPGTEVVHVDDFAGPHVPEWDWPRFQEQVIDPLRAGRAARYQRWEWNRDQPAEWHDIRAGVPVVVEGVSSTRRELDVPWALQVWVDTPRELRLRRAVERDGEGMLAHWLDVWMPLEQAYIDRERPELRVDLVVFGTADP